MFVKENPMHYNLDDKAKEVETKLEEFKNSYAEFHHMFMNYFNDNPKDIDSTDILIERLSNIYYAIEDVCIDIEFLEARLQDLE